MNLEQRLNQFDVILDKRDFVSYILSPVKGGRVYEALALSLLQEDKDVDKDSLNKLEEIAEKTNLKNAAKAIEEIKSSFNGIVVDSTKFDLSDLSEEDRLQFHIKFIKKHANQIILLDGWEFCEICLSGYNTAKYMKIPIVDKNMKVIKSNIVNDAAGMLMMSLKDLCSTNPCQHQQESGPECCCESHEDSEENDQTHA